MNQVLDISCASILVVDDTSETLHLLTEALRSEGYEVRPVLTGKHAIHAALNSPPDLVLLDIMMPEMDGYDVLKELKYHKETEAIPVIFLTSLTDDEDEEKGLSAGAVDYINKPVHLRILKSRVETHLQLKLQRDKLEEQNYELKSMNEELEAFSYSASHDLKAPLGVIKTYSDFIKEHFEDLHDREGISDINEIKIATSRMTQLIEDLLKLSQIGQNTLSIKPINLSQIVENIFTDVNSNMSGVNFQFTCEPDVIVEADENLVQIAISNLIQNACKYSSKVTNPSLRFGVINDFAHKIYFIKDNGIGFDLDKADNLFTAFNRLHTSKGYEGTGIGLTIVKRIIERHNGSIWAESKSGEGAAFYFTFHKGRNKGDS